MLCEPAASVAPATHSGEQKFVQTQAAKLVHS